MADNRNYNVTNEIFHMLNKTKGFEVAMENPKEGVIIIRYNGTSFVLNIDPIFNNNLPGMYEEEKPFSEIVNQHRWYFRDSKK